MDKDIVPDLIKEVEESFLGIISKDPSVKSALGKLSKNQANYQTANNYAIAVGEAMAKAMSAHISSDNLPDGKMYYNIAKRVVGHHLRQVFDRVKDYSDEVQANLNNLANLHLRAVSPVINKDRIDGLVNRLSSENDFDSVSWLLDEPVVNFAQSIVDDSIKGNAEFHHQSGLQPEIIRKETGKCCDWCKAVVGSYKYPDVPSDVYRRHQRCKCTVDYDPKSGRLKDIWGKQWRKSSSSDIIEPRQNIDVYDEMSMTRQRALQLGILSNPLKKRSSKAVEEEIINAISGGDKTRGSCSSCAFAYIGNKAGFEVRDFRGGDSCDLFSGLGAIKNISELKGVDGKIVNHTNDYKATKKLLEEVEEGKEYYFSTGRHAAIIRKKESGFEYLELQSSNNEKNGFKNLDGTALKNRFKAQSKHTALRQKVEATSLIIEVESLGNSEEFQRLLTFINTDIDKQQKGGGGSVK